MAYSSIVKKKKCKNTKVTDTRPNKRISDGKKCHCLRWQWCWFTKQVEQGVMSWEFNNSVHVKMFLFRFSDIKLGACWGTSGLVSLFSNNKIQISAFILSFWRHFAHVNLYMQNPASNIVFMWLFKEISYFFFLPQIQTVSKLRPHLWFPPHPVTDGQGGPFQRGGAKTDGVTQQGRARGWIWCDPAGRRL